MENTVGDLASNHFYWHYLLGALGQFNILNQLFLFLKALQMQVIFDFGRLIPFMCKYIYTNHIYLIIKIKGKKCDSLNLNCCWKDRNTPACKGIIGCKYGRGKKVYEQWQPQ